MNKKVSTLLTVGLMLGGSLLSSSAFAADVKPEQFTGAIKNWVFSLNNLPEDVKAAVLRDGGLVELTGDVTISTNDQGGHPANFVVLPEGITLTSADKNEKVLFKGNILVAGENVAISNLKFTDNIENWNTGGWHQSYITVFADNVNITNNEFVGKENPGTYNDAVILLPQSEVVNYNVQGNTFTGLNHSTNALSSAIKVSLDSKGQYLSADPSDIYDALSAVLKNKKGWTDGKTGKGKSTSIPTEGLGSFDANTFGEGNAVNLLVSTSGEYTTANFGKLVNPNALKEVIESASDNLQIMFEDATVAELQNVISSANTTGKNLVVTTKTGKRNIVIGEGKVENDFGFTTVKAAGAYVEIAKDKTYTLMVGDEFVSADEDGKTVMSGTETYWSVSCPNEGVYSFTSSDGAKLTAADKYTEFEIENIEGATTFKLKVGGKYVGEGFALVGEKKALVFGAHEVTSSIGISAADLNAVNEGSFSIDYRFDANHVAEINPFSGEVKAFDYNGRVFFATSWPESANSKNTLSDSEFEKCVFIVATLDNKWNINNLRESGEGAKFTEVQGDRLLFGVTDNDLKAGKYSINNAGFTVTQNPVSKKYTLKLNGSLSYLDDNNKLLKFLI